MPPDPACPHTVQHDDAALAAGMRAAQSGDRGAYAELLGRITPWLRGYIRKQRPFLQAADVEDLVQDVLLSLHAVRRTYDPGRPFLPWLLAIAHHRMADAARRHASRLAGEALPEALDEANSMVPVTSWGDAANIEESAVGDPQALRQAIRALPAGQRAAIEVLKLKEMSLKEASRELGTSVGALKVAAHRGMASLRRALARKAMKE
ncbi:MAG: RNA polymerase sigma factor [Steroidobacteraceae bacterium]